MPRTQKLVKKSLRILSFFLFLIVCWLFPLNLANAATLPSAVAQDKPEVKIKDDSYTAKFVSQSEKEPITIIVGQTKTVVLKFKNVGTAIWNGEGDHFISAYTMEPRNRSSIFATNGWESKKQTDQIYDKVKPGEVGELEIKLVAPKKVGDYLEKFYLAAENYTWVQGGYFFLKIKVVSTNSNNTNNTNTTTSSTLEINTTTLQINTSSLENQYDVSSTIVEVTSTTSTEENVSSALVLNEEPRIRVGIWKPDDFVQFKSSDDDYNIYDGTNFVGVLLKGDLGVFRYQEGKYNFRGSSFDLISENYFRLSPVNNSHAIFELLNFEHKVKWRGGSRNFDQYRGAVEYRFDNQGKKVYVINDLLFEDYLMGIAEASNSAPSEYIKALMVAARTYAYYIQQSTTKHDERNFDVSGTTGDQLYLGYINEQISLKVDEAVSSTRGQMVTYNDEVVITPYFGHSNGKTRAYKTVWGGLEKPWLVPVKCAYDKGLARYGHGVGMSQRDAALRAEKDKWDYEKILKYYYTGVNIEQIYN